MEVVKVGGLVDRVAAFAARRAGKHANRWAFGVFA